RHANAGHPNPMLLRRGAGVVEWLGMPGSAQIPLGLRSDTVYPDARTPVADRDSIVLLTDGIYEEENKAGEEFGPKRLIAAATKRMEEPCEKLLGNLLRDTQRFAGHEEFADDVCLVGIDVMNGGARK
ncbi:MAG: PP2C family protein-serine/threonine phosphatase, partial [Chthoniobacteraceae bacterium]